MLLNKVKAAMLIVGKETIFDIISKEDLERWEIGVFEFTEMLKVEMKIAPCKVCGRWSKGTCKMCLKVEVLL